MQKIMVNLGQRSYPVFLGDAGPGAFAAKMKELYAGRGVALVTNRTVASLYREQVEAWKRELGAVVHELADGEQYKTIASWSQILDTLLHARLDRRAVLVAFGGGVVGDMGGFAAAAFLRGIDSVQVPTTLLAMVDSSVGGKTGVNHPCGKNLIGAFHQPRMVWADMGYVRTLPPRQYLCGYGELFKCAFIGGPQMFTFIESCHERLARGESGALREGVERSIRIKAHVVASDERETGQRALLNFGHTFAHALEHFFGYEGVLHGEAVLWGICCALDLGIRIGTVSPTDAQRYAALLDRVQLPPLPREPDPQSLYEAMFSDKKTSGGALRFVLPTSPGSAQVGCCAGRDAVLATLQEVFRSGSTARVRGGI